MYHSLRTEISLLKKVHMEIGLFESKSVLQTVAQEITRKSNYPETEKCAQEFKAFPDLSRFFFILM